MAVWVSSSSLKSKMKTLWPRWRKWRARQRPMPCAAPERRMCFCGGAAVAGVVIARSVAEVLE